METKTTTGFTPGPWVIATRNTDVEIGKKYYLQYRHWSAPEDVGTDTTTEPAANARLIASAPELLTALEMALDRFTDNDMIPPNYALSRWIDRARAAIAKAQGK